MDIEIRDARKEDCEAIWEFVQELARFEKMPDGPKLPYEVFKKDGFETEPPLFRDLVAVHRGKIIGHAMYYDSYCSWEGKAMFLDELYVTPEYRNKGVGGRIFAAVAKRAVEHNCARLEFSVLKWNPAKKFYAKRGAVDLTESEEWHHFRLGGAALEKFRDPTNSR